MDFFDVVKQRKSVRVFREKSVENEKIQKIMEAVALAPSAGGLQAYEVVAVREEKRRSDLARAAMSQDFISEAPVVFVLCANTSRAASRYGERGKIYSLQDATIAGAYLQLSASALGLASCWVGAFDPLKVSGIISAPEDIHPVAIIPVGYAGEDPGRTPRRSSKDIFHEEVL